MTTLTQPIAKLYKRATTCRDCNKPINVGASARWYRQAQELACYPKCSDA